MKFLATAAALTALAEAHTLFTTLHINGQNQGDGTCVRQPKDGPTATAPIYPLNGVNQACGRQGEMSVPFVCPAKGGSTLTFEFRMWPNAMNPGSIAGNHKGPCNVYMKQMDDILNGKAAGDGWFKIWENGYNISSDKWCIDTLIENSGLLSIKIPTGLPAGEYIVRPELLALHNATRGDPQFYHSCAQIFIKDGPDVELEIPTEYEVSIPGYLSADDPGLTYDLYGRKPLPEYPIPGPPVFKPTSSAKVVTKKQENGAIPSDCLIINANWCGRPVATFSDEQGCWDGVKACYDQSEQCWATAPTTGHANCGIWSDYCRSMDKQCKDQKFNGPIDFTGGEQSVGPPSDLPDVSGGLERTVAESGSDSKPEASKGEETAEEEYDILEDVKEQSPVKESAPLKVSEDGRCGGSTSQTCKGSSHGICCSKKGRCGRKTRHCTCGCQVEFGDCRD